MPLEADEQATLIEWARWQSWINGRLIAIPNGAHLAGDARARAIQMARLKAQGFREGVSDLFLAIPRHGYAGLWIEMKRADPRRSSVSEAQTTWHNLMIDSGYACVVCYGAIQAIEAILEYNHPKAEPQHGQKQS